MNFSSVLQFSFAK